MELDVCLTRSGAEPWGFRLAGGVDFNMPLTVAKVVPSSPADVAGLRNGDTVVNIDGADASTMTHEDSKTALADAADNLRLGVVRGLYDPVIDEFDPIYEPIDQDDFDQPSQPTEVPDDLDLTLTLPEFANIAPKGINGVVKPLPDLVNGQDSRSLTASPFVLPTKPYRPFSTEPLPEIPALEDPIILNPNFHEDFGRLKDEEEFLPKTRFKLPISEQYDPDGTKQKMKLEVLKGKEVTTKDVIATTTESKTTETTIKKDFEMKEQVMTKQEINFLEKMKKEIDLETIEMTASSIVDESIEKAVTVAEVIKKEIGVELIESSDSETKLKSVKESSACIESNLKSSEDTNIIQEKSSKVKIESKETAVKEVTELVDLIDKTTEEIVIQEEHKEENKISLVDDVESIFDSKQTEREVSKTENLISDQVEVKESYKDESQDVQSKISVQQTKSDTVRQKETHDTTQAQTFTKDSKSETKYSTSKLLSEQRAYAIGLQTIPNIRGTVHSSYHYDLLLKTFFIHLTDVMVALSRFILAEPVLSKPVEETKTTGVPERREARVETISKTKETESVSIQKQEADVKTATQETKSESATVVTAKDQTASRLVTPAKKERVVGKIIKKAQEIKQQDDHQKTKVEQKKVVVHEQNYQTEMKHVDESIKTEEIVKKRDLSGSRMAQLTEKKPEELMQNMENVLTEFESKSSNEDIEVIRERRSKSRSTVVTPVDMMQLEKSSQEISEHTSLTTSAISSMSESKTSKTSESGYESTDFETVDGAKTYIAIVQSHVYTNKDAIFEATSRLGTDETDSKESVEAISAENIEMKSLETREKAVQAVVETSNKMVAIHKEEKIQVAEKIEPKTTVIQEVIKEAEKSSQKEVIKVEKVQDVIIQDKTEPIVDVKTMLTQNYIVTEANEKVETSKSEAANEEKVTIIEELDEKETAVAFTDESICLAKEEVIDLAKKETTIFIKDETISLAKDEVIELAKKETAVTFKDEAISLTKEEVISLKEDSITLKEDALSLKQEIISTTVNEMKKEPIVEKETLAVDSVKDECIIAKEEVTSVKEESIVVEEKEKEGIAIKETKKEETFIAHSFRKDQVSVIEASKESVSVTQESVTLQDVSVIESDESAILKTSEETVIEKENIVIKVDEEVDIKIEDVTINETQSHAQLSQIESKHIEQESTFVAKSINQESNFIARSLDVETKETQQKLSLDLTQKKTESLISDDGDLVKTPTPSTVPPTPLTDEYVFSLVAKLPKREGTPIPRDCTPDDEDEDPHIVKKGLVPHIDAKIEDQKIFDPPLASPSPKSSTSPKSLGLKGGSPVIPIYTKTPVYYKPGLRGGAPISPRLSASLKSPVYVKPGLRGGVADPDYSKEEIKEIERKSSLLASAIDETIKSIEEYKEEVGIKKQATTEHTKEDHTREVTEEITQNGVMYNGYAKVLETKIFDNGVVENTTELESKVTGETNEVESEKKENTQVQSNDVSERVIESTEPKLDLQSEFTQENGLSTTVDVTKMKTNEVANMEEKKHVIIVEEKRDPMEGYRPVPFELDSQRERRTIRVPYLTPSQERELYKTPTGDIIGTHQGIVDGLEEAVVDTEVAKEMGKPGITEEKIAELISGEAEMLREAHVMGLSRVLASHMHRDGDDCSVDFKKIKPIVESLKDSEVLKALNEELLRDAEERKKKEAKKEAWTTFLQKPKRPVPKSKFGYYKDSEEEERKVESYKPKIVKQPKPKVAPDYKPKDFNTGLLPWEERALREPTPPPVEPEDPILIPEEAPEILEAVDPLPESEVPDLEDSGIPLPPPPEPKEATAPPEETPEGTPEDAEELDIEAVIEETEKIVEESLVKEMEGSNIANQIMTSVQNMVDPNAPLEQQLAQMRAQLAALAQLPGVIQQSLELVTRQLATLGQTEATQNPAIEEAPEADMTPAAVEETEVSENGGTTIEEIPQEEPQPEPVEPTAPTLTPEEVERMRKEEEQMLEEQRRTEKQKKDYITVICDYLNGYENQYELMEQARIEHESRQIKQRPTPRVGNPLPDPRVGTPQPNQRGNGKPKPVFGPAAPWERPVVLPGGRKWRTPKDAYNDTFIAETLQAQAELIAGKAMGVNFMKYEKPPVSLDHLKDSDVYKMIHNMEMAQPKRVEMLTPVIAEADYREKCRSMTPCPERLAQQIHP